MTDVPIPTLRQRLNDSDLWLSFKASPVTIVAAFTTLLIFVLAFFAPVFAPQDAFNPAALNLMDGFTHPMERGAGSNMLFLLGSDAQGRDMLSALFYGTRVSLIVGLCSVGFSMLLGISLGLLAGYLGGRVEQLIMRVADIQLSFPGILIALLIFGIARGIIPPNKHETTALFVIILAIGLSHWAQYARTVRASALVERNKDYVQAARLIGIRGLAIMARHILPNVMGPVLVIATINLALAVIEEATLSFFGVGMPVTQPSLGTLIRFGQQYLISGEWWILLFPALTIVILGLAINLLGDWLRDALNPKLR
ncbi:MAG: ABC transporter permease [Methylocystis sp.]|jgi:peptide/nickel transport system permease protein|nr:ABC transporter permease [Methylocystis sp.]MCA3582365.1 ABC transporter permease [Methylocystis sp.]MCA3588260.1 ABC transporter permease [Methylocystis sp.]MCA3590178.1 ABC transporter permease [Methylocystis sp.]